MEFAIVTSGLRVTVDIRCSSGPGPQPCLATPSRVSCLAPTDPPILRSSKSGN